MKILLTGGSGFIGRSLRESLSRDHELTAPAHRELDLTNAALVDEWISPGRFDVVIHSAVPAEADVVEPILRAFWNVLRRAGSVHRVIYFGSGAEFGKHRDLRRVSEKEIGEEMPRDSYGFAKLLCTQEARRREGKILNLRLFGVFGRYEDYRFKFISNSIVKHLLGIDLILAQDAVFDYLWVGDLVDAVRRALEAPVTESDLNLTPTASLSLSQVLEHVGAVSGRAVPYRVLHRGLNFEYTGSNDNFLRRFPGFAFTPPRDAIAELYSYYAARMDLIDKEAIRRDDYLVSTRCRPAQAVSR